jgi:putative ABC transport system permease protein
MNLESIRIALQGIASNKLRSALTMLGIMIGVGSVIVLVAVGTGSRQAVERQFERLGANTINVVAQRGFGGRGGNRGTQSRPVQITDTDIKALQSPGNCASCKTVVPIVNASPVGAYDGNTYTPAQFLGSTADFSSVRNYPVSTGRFISADDVEARAKVVVLGKTVVDNLFGTGTASANAVGQAIKFGNSSWVVVGVFATKGTNGTQDLDDIVVAPDTAVQDSLTGTATYSSITVQAISRNATGSAQTEVTSVLSGLHKTTTGSSPFSVLNQATLQSSQEQSAKTLTVLLGAVAAISLIVGGIGVMNIMLVTVTERTREIGVRRAIGAQRSDVLGQFLVEAVMVSMLGGLLGVGAGLVGSQFKIVGIQPTVALYSVFLAFGVSVLTGLFFGLYPANRAASLRPIDALRYE